MKLTGWLLSYSLTGWLLSQSSTGWLLSYSLAGLFGSQGFHRSAALFLKKKHLNRSRGAGEMKVGTIDPRAHEVFVSENLLRQVGLGIFLVPKVVEGDRGH